MVSENAQSKQVDLGFLGTHHCHKSWSWLAKGVSPLEWLTAGATDPLSPPLPPPHHMGSGRWQSQHRAPSPTLCRTAPVASTGLSCPEMPDVHWEARVPTAVAGAVAWILPYGSTVTGGDCREGPGGLCHWMPEGSRLRGEKASGVWALIQHHRMLGLHENFP